MIVPELLMGLHNVIAPLTTCVNRLIRKFVMPVHGRPARLRMAVAGLGGATAQSANDGWQRDVLRQLRTGSARLAQGCYRSVECAVAVRGHEHDRSTDLLARRSSLAARSDHGARQLVGVPALRTGGHDAHAAHRNPGLDVLARLMRTIDGLQNDAARAGMACV